MSEVFKSMRRAPYQTLAAMMVLFFTLFLSSALFVSLSFVNGLLGYVETRPQVTVYFRTQTPETEISKVREELINSGKVESIKYVSKEDAYQIYRNVNKDNPLLLEMVSSDILPPSLEIYAKKPVYLPEIADYLQNKSGVDEVNFQKDIVNRLLTLTTILRRVTVLFFGFLILMSIVVLTTTTLFKIALKKNEIEVLQLLGASSFYIRKPFLNEGIFLGSFTSLLSFGILTLILVYLNPFLSSYLRGIPNLTYSFFGLQLTVWPLNPLFMLITLGVTTLFGVIIAVIANLLATAKYLK